MKTNNEGLLAKYIITKANGDTVDPAAKYFVLRLDLNAKDQKHIEACRKAVQTYANEIESHLPELAKDIREKYPV